MKKLLVLLWLFAPAIAYGQIQAQATFNLCGTPSANCTPAIQVSPSIDIRGSGVDTHSLTWNVNGTVAAGACRLESSTDNVSFPTQIIAPQTVTSNGGPINGTGVVNYVRINCTTPITGTGYVQIRYVGTASNGGALGASVSVINTPNVAVTNTPAVTGSGTFTVGQSTAANLKVDLSGTASNTAAIKVDGSASTQPVSGTVTALAGGTFPANLSAVGGTSVSGANIIDAPNNAVKINCIIGCSATPGFADNSAFTANTTTFAITGGVFNDGIGGVTSTNAGAARITANRGLHINLRNANGTEIGTLTNPVRTDPSGSTAQPVSGTITANAGAGNFTVVQGTGTNLHAVLDSGSTTTVTQGTGSNLHVVVDTAPTTTVTGTLTANAGTGFNVAQGSTTSGQLGALVQGAVTTASPTYTNGQTSPLNLDTNGNLRVNVTSGSTGNAAAGNTGAAVPAQADYTGLNVAGNLRGATAVNPTGTVYAQQMDIASIAGNVTLTGHGTAANALRVELPTDGTGVVSSHTQDNAGNAINSTANALHGIVRDAAGNGRGANVNASNQLSVSVDNTATVTANIGNTPNTTPILVSQDASKTYTNTVMQNAQTGSANGTVLAVDGQALAHLALNCTVSCTGSVNFEGQSNTADFGPVWANQDGTSTLATSATYSASATGVIQWTVFVGGLKQLRARTSGWSGTITINGIPSPMPMNPPVVNANVTATGGLALDSNLGATADAAASPGGTGSVSAKLRSISSQTDSIKTDLDTIAGTVATAAVKIRATDGTAIQASTEPCDGVVKTKFNVQVAGTTAVQLIAGTAAQTTYICSIHIHGNTTSDEIVSIIEGTQTTNPCDTGATALDGSTTAANGLRIGSGGGGFVNGTGANAVYQTPATNHQVCVLANGSNRVTVSGSYVKQ